MRVEYARATERSYKTLIFIFIFIKWNTQILIFRHIMAIVIHDYYVWNIIRNVFRHLNGCQFPDTVHIFMYEWNNDGTSFAIIIKLC